MRYGIYYIIFIIECEDNITYRIYNIEHQLLHINYKV